MSVVGLLGIKDRTACFVVSLIEMIAFCFISVIYFILSSGIYAGTSAIYRSAKAKPPAATAPAATEAPAADGPETTTPTVAPAPKSSSLGDAVSQMLADMPWWVWTIVAIGYLALITIYWAPPAEQQVNDMQLRAFTVLAAVAAIGVMVKACWYVGSLGFWDRVAR